MPEFDLAAWLLNAETPTIRYLTACQLLEMPENDPQVEVARQQIMTEGPVPAVLAHQTKSGKWANENSYYTPKYISTHWSLVLLMELCVDPQDIRFQRGVTYMLNATESHMETLLNRKAHGFSCLWGNILRYALYAGLSDDPRVQAIIEFSQQALLNGYCLCQYNDCYSCAWGVARTLWGLAALPSEERPPAIQEAISDGISFLVESFNLVEANYPTPVNGTIHPLWYKLNFPLFYQADILFVLRVLDELDALEHPRIASVLDWLESKRAAKGHWKGVSPYARRTWCELGDTTETARWVSLQSALILKRARRIETEKC
jgi:hypothetical protein